jgi:hypothetical protein
MDDNPETKRVRTVLTLPPTMFIDRTKMPDINEHNINEDIFIEYKGWYLAEKERLSKIKTDHPLLKTYIDKLNDEYEYVSSLLNSPTHVTMRQMPIFFGQRRNPLFNHIVFDISDDEEEEAADSVSSVEEANSSNSESDSSTDNENYPIPADDE